MEEGNINIKVTDREGKVHDLEAPTDMNLNLMEVLKSYELPVEGTCGGMALCASCHCYVESEHELKEQSEDEEDMSSWSISGDDDGRIELHGNSFLHDNVD